MAYETGSATGIVDLLSKLSTFATTYCGYTQTATAGSGTSDYVLYLTKSSKTFAFICTENLDATASPWLSNIGVQMFVLSGAYDSGSSKYDQPGMCTSANKYDSYWMPTTNYCNGSVTEYHFFYDGSILAFVFKTSQNLWVHSAFGFATKLNTFTGPAAFIAGDYFNTNDSSTDSLTVNFRSQSSTAPFLCNHRYANSTPSGIQMQVEDGGSGEYYMANDHTSYTYPNMIGYMATNNALNCDPGNYIMPDCLKALGSFNRYGGTVILQPTLLYVQNIITTSKYMLYAELSSIRSTNMSTLLEGSEITYDSGTWKLFPCKRRSNLNDAGGGHNPNSYYLGIAYLKDTTTTG